MRWLAIFIVFLSSTGLLAHAAGVDPVVKVKGGEIRGRLIEGGGATFKGVPFAQPPVGDLRWRDPLPVTPWTGVRDAGDFGASCAQPKMASSAPNAQSYSEDCLFLNVWTPEWPAKSPKAVMVWIFGGANIAGTTSIPLFDGTSLSRRDVVVVTINFRLGIFGFYAHPGLTAESSHHSSGNYGLLDQLAALKWIHENIARFGGDPQRVTLFGQSSGAIDTAALVASPLSKGLIQRAIQESGPPIRPIDPLAQDEQLGVTFAAELKAPADPTAAVKYLRSLSTAELDKAAQKLGGPGDAVPLKRPLIDGYLIPRYPALIYEDAQDPPIPMMIGNNARETDRDYSPAVMKKWIKDSFGSLAPQAEKFYGWADGGTGFSDPFFGPTHVQIRADVRDRCPAIAQSIWRADNRHPTYEYLWDPAVPGEPATRHGAELPFVFGNMLSKGEYSGPFGPDDKKISDQVQAYWTNFAKTGDPNGKGLPEWPRFDGASRPYLEFTAHDGEVVKQNLRRDICDLYIQALKETIPGNTAGDFPQF